NCLEMKSRRLMELSFSRRALVGTRFGQTSQPMDPMNVGRELVRVNGCGCFSKVAKSSVVARRNRNLHLRYCSNIAAGFTVRKARRQICEAVRVRTPHSTGSTRTIASRTYHSSTGRALEG